MQSPHRRKFLQTTAISIAIPSVASPQTSPEPRQRRSTGRDPAHEQFIRQAIELAASARKNGNHPFGALLVDERGRVILTAENTALTTHDPTRHAELNLVQLACAKLPADTLAKATLYTSTEPCIMCCGAIHWAGISSVVYGCSAKTLSGIVKSDDFLFPCRETFRRTKQPSVLVIGPVLEAEAVVVHRGFWN
jgi:tRNA(Arg) A34 adenosine deaminase TadA